MDELTLRRAMRPSALAPRGERGAWHDGVITTGARGLAGVDELAASGQLTDIAAWEDGECWLLGPALGPGWHPGPPLFGSRSELVGVAAALAERAGYAGDLQAGPAAVWADAQGCRTWLDFSGPRWNLEMRVPYLRAYAMAELVDAGMFPAEVAEFVRAAYAAQATMLIAGPGGAGKTTVIRCLLEQIDESERIVAMEELAELRLGRRNVVPLAGRPANAEGIGARGLAEMVKHALYGSADRLAVGELRGAEAEPFLEAVSSGHLGSIGAIHAGSARQAMRKLVQFAAQGSITETAAAAQARGGIHLVVVLADKRSGHRVIEVAEIGAGSPALDSDVPLGTLWEGGRWLVDCTDWRPGG